MHIHMDTLGRTVPRFELERAAGRYLATFRHDIH
jgi:hypothetical protein